MQDETALYGAKMMQPGMTAADSEENNLRPQHLEDYIGPSSPKPDSEARMAWRQAVRNKRNAVVVTIFRCFLVRRWQNSRIQQSIRLRCFFSFLIVPCF